MIHLVITVVVPSLLILWLIKRLTNKQTQPKPRYSDAYELWADSIEKCAFEKLDRPLTSIERDSIRRAPSLMTLELVALKIENAETKDDLEYELKELAGSHQRELELFKTDIADGLAELLGRSLHSDDMQDVHSVITNCLICLLYTSPSPRD